MSPGAKAKALLKWLPAALATNGFCVDEDTVSIIASEIDKEGLAFEVFDNFTFCIEGLGKKEPTP